VGGTRPSLIKSRRGIIIKRVATPSNRRRSGTRVSASRYREERDRAARARAHAHVNSKMRARVARLSLSLARRSIDRINDREAKAVSVSLAPA